jgi:pimeloyl-ACP methyl ester carboxylesterase
MRFPASVANVARFGRTLPGLRGSHMLAGAGHWVQRERAAEVNAFLIEFLRSL